MADVLTGTGTLDPADLAAFITHVQQAAEVYRDAVTHPPQGMTAEQALRALTRIPSHRLTSDLTRDELDRLLDTAHRSTPSTPDQRHLIAETRTQLRNLANRDTEQEYTDDEIDQALKRATPHLLAGRNNLPRHAQTAAQTLLNRGQPVTLPAGVRHHEAVPQEPGQSEQQTHIRASQGPGWQYHARRGWEPDPDYRPAGQENNTRYRPQGYERMRYEPYAGWVPELNPIDFNTAAYRTAHDPHTRQNVGVQPSRATFESMNEGSSLKTQRNSGSESEKYTLEIHVHQSGKTMQPGGRSRLGHAWVGLGVEKGLEKSFRTYGFYPVDWNDDRPLEWTKGEVRHNYDNPADAEVKLVVNIDKSQLESAVAYIEKNRSHKYHVLSYNCATFARSVYKASIGKNAPGKTIGPDTPMALRKGIEEHNATRRRGGSRDAGLDPTRLPLGHALVVEGPRTGGVVRVDPSAVTTLGENGERTGKQTRSGTRTRFELPDPNRSEASFGYEIGDAGDIRIRVGEQTAVLPADGWIAYGDDFLQLGEGMLLRGDTGWVGRIDNWDTLRDTLSDREPTHGIHSDGQAVHVLPQNGTAGPAIRLPLIPAGVSAVPEDLQSTADPREQTPAPRAFLDTPRGHVTAPQPADTGATGPLTTTREGLTGLWQRGEEPVAFLNGAVDAARQAVAASGGVDGAPAVDYAMAHAEESESAGGRRYSSDGSEQDALGQGLVADGVPGNDAGLLLYGSSQVRTDRWLPFGSVSQPEVSQAFEFATAADGTRSVSTDHRTTNSPTVDRPASERDLRDTPEPAGAEVRHSTPRNPVSEPVQPLRRDTGSNQYLLDIRLLPATGTPEYTEHVKTAAAMLRRPDTTAAQQTSPPIVSIAGQIKIDSVSAIQAADFLKAVIRLPQAPSTIQLDLGHAPHINICRY